MIERIGNGGDDDDWEAFDPWLEEFDRRSHQLERCRRLNPAAVLLAGAAVAAAALWSGTGGDSVAARDQPAASAEADPDSAASAANYPLCDTLPMPEAPEPKTASNASMVFALDEQAGCQIALYESSGGGVASYVEPGARYAPTCVTDDSRLRMAAYSGGFVTASGYTKIWPDQLSYLESIAGPLPPCGSPLPPAYGQG